MIGYGKYIGFMHYFSSQALISEEPILVTNDFYFGHLSPAFKLEDGSQLDFGKEFYDAIKEFCELRLNELLQTTPESSSYSTKVEVTKDYLKGKSQLLQEEPDNFNVNQQDFIILTNCDLPKLETDFTPVERPKTQFYYFLFRGLAARFLNSFYAEFTSRSLEGKEKMICVFKSLEDEICGAAFQIRRVNHDVKNEFELFTQKKNNDYTFRSLGLILIWVYSEVKVFFEIENIETKSKGIKELSEEYPFDNVSKGSEEKYVTNMYGRVTRRFISKSKFNKDKAKRLIDIIKDRYLGRSSPHLGLIQKNQLKSQLVEMIQVLENLIFINEFGYNSLIITGSFDELISSAFQEKIYSLYKNYLVDCLEKETTELHRIEVISSEQRKLKFLNTLLDIEKENYQESIPRRVNNHLEAVIKIPYQRYGTRNSLGSLKNIGTNQKEIMKSENRIKTKLVFGFNGDKEKLLSVLDLLNRKIGLVKDPTSINDLKEVLIAEEIDSGLPRIYLDCQTRQFGYIIERMGFCFKNLNPTTVFKSHLFYPKKADKPIKNGTLYSGKKGKDVKDKSSIDKIIKQLQEKVI